MTDRQLVADLLSALEYHVEQTRPIESSKVAIEAAREHLAQPAPAQVPFLVRLYNEGYHAGHHHTVEGYYTHVVPQEMDTYHSDLVAEWLADNPQAQPAPVPGVVLRDGQPTLLRDRDIKTTDVRLCVIKENQP